jgi:hypothetical protein
MLIGAAVYVRTALSQVATMPGTPTESPERRASSNASGLPVATLQSSVADSHPDTTLRISHFPDPPTTSLEPPSPPRLDVMKERGLCSWWSPRRTLEVFT